MVFSSIQGYVVDPPNWHHQQPNHHQQNGSDNIQLLPPLPPQVGGSTCVGGGTMGSIRPGSMADRARLAKLPPPEPALKCPRCDSTNTKFCYFNNYSLTQPRHFCKACRRYWTRGGALRNVPVGGGCRRNNKKNKRNRSKSPNSTNSLEKQTSSSSAIPSHNHELIGHHQLPQTITNLPFMASMQNHLSRYVVGNVNMGLGLREIQEQQQQQTDHMGIQIGVGNGNSPVSASAAVAGGGVGVDQWRNLQQFPFLNTFESNSGGNNSYPFQGESNIEAASSSGFVGDHIASNPRVVNQEPPLKMEENRGLNLSRSSLGIPEHNNQQFYSWNDLSGSSTTHLL